MVIKHKDYIRCLKQTGVQVSLGRFKKKEVKYSNHKCRISIFTYEEKETDVGLAVGALELFSTKKRAKGFYINPQLLLGTLGATELLYRHVLVNIHCKKNQHANVHESSYPYLMDPEIYEDDLANHLEQATCLIRG
jgi:hypothetical protein